MKSQKIDTLQAVAPSVIGGGALALISRYHKMRIVKCSSDKVESGKDATVRTLNGVNENGQQPNRIRQQLNLHPANSQFQSSLI